MSEVKTSLVADIGGTNVRFALVPVGTTEPQREQILRCGDFDGPVEAVRHYLSLVGNPDLGIAAFDVATAVTGDQISLTNGPWSFSIMTSLHWRWQCRYSTSMKLAKSALVCRYPKPLLVSSALVLAWAYRACCGMRVAGWRCKAKAVMSRLVL
jgi:glucokinase